MISPAGLITGTARTRGPRTVTVTATTASGGIAVTTFLDHLATESVARDSHLPR